MDVMFCYTLFWVSVVGLCCGSFFNVVILRTLSNESIVFPSSKCPKCNHKLYWWHNIPVLSFILLRGKCYFCNEKISFQYPIVELITMILFAVAFLKFGLTLKMFFAIFWISCLIIMTGTDLKEKIVDCNIAIIMAVGACIYHILTGGWHALIYSVTGLIAGALIMEIVARSGYLVAGTRAMGEADTYVAGALGAIATLNGVLQILLFGFIASMVFILPMYWYQRYKNNDKLTCIFMILFTVSVVCFKRLELSYFSFLPVIITGLVLVFSVMRGIREEQNRSYIPYVPALAAGCLYFIMSM